MKNTITPKQFLESKGWKKDSPLIGGALFIAISEMLKEYANEVNIGKKKLKQTK
jgi:hypothetical protein|tara:strand:+ start:257 stop:418 length:162 start_codon:yes stop_codon:yes gene_type:complete